MADLPDYYTQTSIAEAEAARFKGGAFAARPLIPTARDIYYATDTKVLYICVVDGDWTGFDASILVQGTQTLYKNMDANSKKIINLAAPTLANDATRKAYVDDAIGGDVAAHAALTTGVHGVGAGAIVGTTLAQELTNKTLTAPVINGEVTTTGLTLPAHSSGDISLGDNRVIFTFHLLKSFDASYLGLRNVADDAFRGMYISNLIPYGYIAFQATANYIAAPSINNAYITFKARITDGASTEVARLQGAATPTFDLKAGRLTGALNANSQQINSLPAPVAANDAARKAYVDAQQIATSISEPARALDTVYQNTSGKARVVCITVGLADTEKANLYFGSADPPDTVVGYGYNQGAGGTIVIQLVGVVPDDYYYKLVTAAGTPLIIEWIEYDLGIT